MDESSLMKVSHERIGANCFYDAISCMLEYAGVPYYTLEFVGYHFIYNDNTFSRFAENSVRSDMIPEKNDFYLKTTPKSQHKEDYLKLVNDTYNVNFRNMTVRQKVTINDLYNMSQFLSDIEKPISVYMNPFECTKFYKLNNFDVPSSNWIHMVNVLEYDKKKRRTLIIDRGFNCFGAWIDDTLFYDSINSEYLEKNHMEYIELSKNIIRQFNIEYIKNILIRNINSSLRTITVINGMKYLINSDALQEWKNNFINIINYLEEKYGLYAPQFLWEALVLYLDEVHGLPYAFEGINRFIKSNAVDNLLVSLEEYAVMWEKFETLLKIVAIKKERLSSRISSFERIIDSIIIKDKVIIEKMKELLIELK